MQRLKYRDAIQLLSYLNRHKLNSAKNRRAKARHCIKKIQKPEKSKEPV